MDVDSLSNTSLGVTPRHIVSPADPSILRETLAKTVVISLDLYAPEIIQRRNGAQNLNGWHRDIAMVGVVPTDPLAFLSIFTLLSDVGESDGEFEFIPRLPERVPANGEACVQMTGQSGRSLLWNRSFFHRASPNNGPRRRRIQKVSVQPARRPNDRLGLKEFRAIDDVNPDLRSLLGAGFHSGGEFHSAANQWHLRFPKRPGRCNSAQPVV